MSKWLYECDRRVTAPETRLVLCNNIVKEMLHIHQDRVRT